MNMTVCGAASVLFIVRLQTRATYEIARPYGEARSAATAHQNRRTMRGNSMAEAMASQGEMKRSLTLTGVTVNAMALIAPGAFLWTTFQTQAALQRHGASTGGEMWTGLFFALILAMLTAYSYSELSR